MLSLPLLNAGSVPFSDAALSAALQPQQQPPSAAVSGSPPAAANQTAPGRPLTSEPLLLRSVPHNLLSHVELTLNAPTLAHLER